MNCIYCEQPPDAHKPGCQNSDNHLSVVESLQILQQSRSYAENLLKAQARVALMEERVQQGKLSGMPEELRQTTLKEYA